jgi:hypothetical protein
MEASTARQWVVKRRFYTRVEELLGALASNQSALKLYRDSQQDWSPEMLSMGTLERIPSIKGITKQ